MRDPSVSEGDLVYVRNHGVKGRNKIQDVWEPTPYRVVRCPPERGVVYSITPAVQDGPVRQVHRTELRGMPVGGLRIDAGHNVGEEQGIGDIGETDVNPTEVLTCESYGEESLSEPELCPEAEVVEGEDEDLETETEESPLVLEGLRRSSRSTAGKHGNLFRLPTSVIPNNDVSV